MKIKIDLFLIVLTSIDVWLCQELTSSFFDHSSLSDSKASAAKRAVDIIENGWIEIELIDGANNEQRFQLDEASYLFGENEEDDGRVRHVVKCDDGFGINSNSNFVRRHSVRGAFGHLKWLPVDGYLNKRLPLCAKTCRFQSTLKNGNVQIDSSVRLPSSAHKNSSLNTTTIELFEYSRIKYTCFEGYQLKSTIHPATNKLQPLISSPIADSLSHTVFNKKHFIDKCESAPLSLPSLIAPLQIHDLAWDYFTGSKLVLTQVEHECVKLCPLPTTPKSKLNGMLVPVRDAHRPNDRLTLMCREGYATTINNRTSNLFNFECGSSGAWTLVEPPILVFTVNATTTTEASVRNLTGNETWITASEMSEMLGSTLSAEDELELFQIITRVPRCERLGGGSVSFNPASNEDESLDDQESGSSSSRESTNNGLLINPLTFENLKRVSIMFIVCLIMTSVVILAVLKYKLNKHQRLNTIIQEHHQRHNSSESIEHGFSRAAPGPPPLPPPPPPPLNPATHTVQDFSTNILNPSAPFVFDGPAQQSGVTRPLSNSSSSYLPSYEEAIAQPSVPSYSANRALFKQV